MFDYLKARRQDWILTLQKGKMKKGTNNFKHHKEALLKHQNYEWKQVADNVYQVNIKQKKLPSQLENECEDVELFQLKYRCWNVCLDPILCTCSNYSIYYEFCKHGHLALLYKAGKLEQCHR